MKAAIQIVLLAVILVLGYLLYQSIMKPIRFNKQKLTIEQSTIQRLKDIRSAQVAFKSEYSRYTGDFDSLITFVKDGTFSVVQAIGSIPDSLLEEGMTEKEAVKQGIISRDTVRIGVLDSLFTRVYPIDSLRFVPHAGSYQFDLGAGWFLTGSKVRVPVFEAKVPYKILLSRLDPQLVINYTEEREKITGYPGLRVGSLTEATNNAGNWE
ncbi:MAG: hypothetical protein ISS19_01895 [Bacteroidales bacterium]|nr:hypothetical protein [Bacteroidales bacterium]